MDKVVDPIVTVVMPVYNAGLFLSEAVESILNQAFQNFELLLFDDCSTDNSISIIKSFHDERIKSFFSPVNRGYVHHLNEGLRIAKGKYIARMDADDISDLQRLERQVTFMENNPQIGICGTSITVIDNNNKIVRNELYEVEDSKLRVKLMINSCFAHPSVIFRKNVLKEHNLFYNPDLMPAEDYALWCELSAVTKLANLPETLLKYRSHEEQITKRKRHLQRQAASVIRVRMTEVFLNRRLNEEESYLHNSLLTGDYVISKDYVVKARHWIELLTARSTLASQYNISFLREEMGKTWFNLCTHSYKLGPWIVFTFLSLDVERNVPVFDFIKFIVKSIFKFSPFEMNLSKKSSSSTQI